MDTLVLVTTLAGMIVPIAEVVGGKLLKLDGAKARLLSWLIGVLLGFGAGALGLAPDLMQGGLLGFLAALVANGVFTIDQVKKFLETIKLREHEPVAMAPHDTGTKPVDKRVEDILRNRR